MDVINNIDDLTVLLNEIAIGVKNETVSVIKAKAIAKIADKILQGKKTTLEYQKERGEKPHIAFLETEIPCNILPKTNC